MGLSPPPTEILGCPLGFLGVPPFCGGFWGGGGWFGLGFVGFGTTDDFEREIEAHPRRLETDRLIADGMTAGARPRDAARRSVRRRAGGARAAVSRAAPPVGRAIGLGPPALKTCAMRYAACCRSPAFLATTVVTLAVALGLVTVLFTIFNAYVLRPFACTILSLRRSVARARMRAARDSGGVTTKNCARGRICSNEVIAERGRAVVSEMRAAPPLDGGLRLRQLLRCARHLQSTCAWAAASRNSMRARRAAAPSP